MKKIAIIPARSGSKGLKNKNVLLVNSKPLIAYTIEAALKANCFSKIIVTTDSQEYIDLLSAYPIDFIKRAPELATDKASSFVVIEDVLQKYENLDFSYFVLLQPTSPLRDEHHILQACQQFEDNFQDFNFLVSVCQSDKNTALIKALPANHSLANFDADFANYNRQQYQTEYAPNGAIFIGKSNKYLEKKHFYGADSLAFIMEKSASLDIDDAEDFEYFYFKKQLEIRQENLLKNIREIINLKEHTFKIKKDISLIGHSILAQWNIDFLANYSVQNLAISGISSAQYLEFVIEKNLLTEVGDIAILMFGTNDILTAEVDFLMIKDLIQKIVNHLKNIKPKCEIYFLEILPTIFRLDRNNQQIQALNSVLKADLVNVNFINLYDLFCDKYQKLNLNLTSDGLHLNAAGYALLEKVITEKLQEHE